MKILGLRFLLNQKICEACLMLKVWILSLMLLNTVNLFSSTLSFVDSLKNETSMLYSKKERTKEINEQYINSFLDKFFVVIKSPRQSKYPINNNFENIISYTQKTSPYVCIYNQVWNLNETLILPKDLYFKDCFGSLYHKPSTKTIIEKIGDLNLNQNVSNSIILSQLDDLFSQIGSVSIFQEKLELYLALMQKVAILQKGITGFAQIRDTCNKCNLKEHLHIFSYRIFSEIKSDILTNSQQDNIKKAEWLLLYTKLLTGINPVNYKSSIYQTLKQVESLLVTTNELKKIENVRVIISLFKSKHLSYLEHSTGYNMLRSTINSIASHQELDSFEIFKFFTLLAYVNIQREFEFINSNHDLSYLRYKEILLDVYTAVRFIQHSSNSILFNRHDADYFKVLLAISIIDCYILNDKEKCCGFNTIKHVEILSLRLNEVDNFYINEFKNHIFNFELDIYRNTKDKQVTIGFLKRNGVTNDNVINSNYLTFPADIRYWDSTQLRKYIHTVLPNMLQTRNINTFIRDRKMTNSAYHTLITLTSICKKYATQEERKGNYKDAVKQAVRLPSLNS
jgi:hypothetical protein